jgi:hypothetical protein
MPEIFDEYNSGNNVTETDKTQEYASYSLPDPVNDIYPSNTENTESYGPQRKKRRRFLLPLAFVATFVTAGLTLVTAGYLSVRVALSDVSQSSADVSVSVISLTLKAETGNLTYSLVERGTENTAQSGSIPLKDSDIRFDGLKSMTQYSLRIYDAGNVVKQFDFSTPAEDAAAAFSPSGGIKTTPEAVYSPKISAAPSPSPTEMISPTPSPEESGGLTDAEAVNAGKHTYKFDVTYYKEFKGASSSGKTTVELVFSGDKLQINNIAGALTTSSWTKTGEDTYEAKIDGKHFVLQFTLTGFTGHGEGYDDFVCTLIS